MWSSKFHWLCADAESCETGLRALQHRAEGPCPPEAVRKDALEQRVGIRLELLQQAAEQR